MHMKKNMILQTTILVSVLLSLFIIGCSQELDETVVLNDTLEENMTEPAAKDEPNGTESKSTETLNQTGQETPEQERSDEEREQSSSLLVVEKCDRDDVSGVSLQYAGCMIDEQNTIVSMELANSGNVPIEGLYLYVLNVSDDRVLAETSLEDYVIEGDLYIEPKTIDEMTYSVVDIEDEYGVPLQKILLSPIVTLENGTQAACYNYRIGYRPYDCRHSRR